MNEQTQSELLRFAESVANSSSGNLHGFYSGMLEDARRVVKAAGGTLRKVGRYEANSCEHKPHAEYVDGRWVDPVLDTAADEWSFPVLTNFCLCRLIGRKWRGARLLIRNPKEDARRLLAVYQVETERRGYPTRYVVAHGQTREELRAAVEAAQFDPADPATYPAPEPETNRGGREL